MSSRQVAVIGVPSSAGARRTGQEQAPAALRAAGILERLRARGLDVTDLGDLPTVSFRPDPSQPRRQNLALVADMARQAADRVEQAVASHQWPLVLGGDCSLSLGVLAGLIRRHPRLGLLYFDGDVDLNTPETTPSGVFDGMVMAHILGRGAPELVGIGPRVPLLSEQDVVLFGYDVASGWIDPPELEALERSSLSKYPLARVQADAAGAAREALCHLEKRSDVILVHFDVDVSDLPAADVPHQGALSFDRAAEVLKLFVASSKCAGLVVTEFNPRQDAGGSLASRLADRLAEAVGGARDPRG